MKRTSVVSLCITILLFSSCMQNKPLVIGHRGAMGHVTENTVASVQKALDLGVDMIEIDVFKIKSGEIVVFHDDKLGRLTNADGAIEDRNYDELQEVTLDGRHQIPLLQEVLKTINHQVKLNIELKGGGTTDSVNSIINSFIENEGWKTEDFIISSFKWDELREMRTINPDIPIAILTEKDPALAIDIAKELNAEAINPNFRMLNAENNLEIKEAGFKIYTWTVNEPQDIMAMKRLGVDGIITNYPERVR